MPPRIHRLADTPWTDPASYRGPRFVRPAPPELILAAEEADRRLNALDRSGFRLTIFERRQMQKQQDRQRTAAHSHSAGNSELEPDGQDQGNRSPDRQSRQGQGLGGRTALLSSGLQRGERHVRDEISHSLKREHSRRAGRQPVAPCGLATDFLYEAALWTATATLVLGIVLWVVP